MNADDNADDRARNLSGRLAGEISRAKDLAKQSGRNARNMAATEDAVAETMDRMAQTRGDDAAHYEALADEARKNAARERQHAADYDREAESDA